MIFVTGDTHGDFDRLSFKKWPISSTLTKDDYLIILGDCGLIFHPVTTPEEKYWKKWLEGKPFTTLFICGNHENHPKLNALPRKEMFGGIVGAVSDNIYHLRRGEIYTLGGKKILAFGGAQSHDKHIRKAGIDWWEEEIPSYEDMENALTNLENHGNEVDYILAHTCPLRCLSYLSQALGKGIYKEEPTYNMLSHLITSCLFKEFFCGHWHIDQDFDNYHFVYRNILKI